MTDKDIKTLEDIWIDKAKLGRNIINHTIQMLKDVMRFHSAYSTSENQDAIRYLQESRLCIEDAVRCMIRSRDFLQGKVGIVDTTTPEDFYLAGVDHVEPIEVTVLNSIKESLPNIIPPKKKKTNKHGIVVLEGLDNEKTRTGKK